MSSKQRGVVLGQFAKWLFDHRGSAERTRRAYVLRIIQAERWLVEHEGLSIVWASTKDLQKFLFSIAPTARNRNHCRQALVAFGAFLVDQGYTRENPAAALPRLPERRPLPKALTEEQMALVLDTAIQFGPREAVIVSLPTYTGMRRTAVRTLQWSQLDLDGGWVIFKAKGGEEKMLPLHPVLKERLVEWRRLNNSPWVLPSPLDDSRPLSDTQFGVIVKQVGEAAGIHLHPHILRHTFATLELESGADLATIKELLGHTSLATTTMYLRVRNADLRAAVNKLHLEPE